jgi:ATP-dependent helicase YprA (DUF1998 family)
MDLTLVGCPPLSLSAFHSLKALPIDTVSSWTTKQKKYVLLAFFRLDYLTDGKKSPRLFQIEAMLAVLGGRDLIVRAGTGYGKTLCMVLPLLVTETKLAVTITPLKLLQKNHVCIEIYHAVTRLTALLGPRV